MATRSVIANRSFSGRAGSGIQINREAQSIRRQVQNAIAKRDWGVARRYLSSIRNKSQWSQVNGLVENLLSIQGQPRWSKKDSRRNFSKTVFGRIDNVALFGRQKQRVAKSNVARAAAANTARGLNKSRVSQITKNGVIYKINKSGGFERIGFTKAEQARRDRISKGTATAKDLFAGQNQRTLQGQINIFNRTIASARGADKQRRIESQFKIMQKAGLPRAKVFDKKTKTEPKAMLVPATKIEKAQMKIGLLEKARKDAIRKNGTFTSLYGTLGVPLGFLKGISNTAFSILKPKQTLADLKQFARTFFKAPVKTTVSVARGASQQFITDPAVFIGEYYAYGKATNTAISVTRRSAFGRAFQKELFLLQQPKELRTPMRKIINAAEAQRKLNPTPAANIKKISFYDVKELNPTEARALASALRKTDSIVFGSKASRVLSKGRTKIPKDVDLATKDPSKFNKEFLDSLPKTQRRLYTIKKEKILRGKTPILDVKPIARLIPERSILTRTGYLPVSGYVQRITTKKGSVLPRLAKKPFQAAFEVKTAPLQKVAGIKLTGFGEQTLRKALGTLQVLVEKNSRRAKDPSALLESLQIQLAALKKSKKLTLFKRRKIKQLSDAIKLLKSKQFQKLLEKKVPGLTKEFPLVGKLTKAKHNAFLKKLKAKSGKAAIKKKVLKKAVKRVTKKKVAKKSSSLVPKKRRASKVPSKVPSKLKSKVPSRTPSRVPSRLKSKVPSKLASRVPSKVPSKVTSKVPSRTPSKVPSKTPSRVPSKVPSRVPGSSTLPKRPVRPIKVAVPSNKPPKDVKNPKGYDVYVRSAGKWKRLNKQAYTKAGAAKFGRWLANNSVARSFVRVGVARKAQKLPQYVAKTSSKLFRKPKSKSKLAKRTTIEKRKFAINTRGEKKGLKAAQLLKRVRKPSKKKKVAKKAKKRPSKRK